jgi:hypothetical protein
MPPSRIPYELKFEKRQDYLYALVRAKSIDRDTAVDYLGRIAERCEDLECTKLLLERDIPMMLNDSDLYFTTNDFLRMLKGVKVAFYNPHITIERAMAFAIVIGNTSGAKFAVYSSLTDAESWLVTD